MPQRGALGEPVVCVDGRRRLSRCELGGVGGSVAGGFVSWGGVGGGSGGRVAAVMGESWVGGEVCGWVGDARCEAGGEPTLGCCRIRGWRSGGRSVRRW